MNITKNVVFEKKDYALVKKQADKNGYGQRGFSAMLRRIIREWSESQKQPKEAQQ
jgi:hypothetical protein